MSTAEIEGQRIRLEAYFAERGVAARDSRDEIARLLNKYSDPSTGGFEKMWRNLAKKYDKHASAGGATRPTSTSAHGGSSKQAVYPPERIEDERQRLRAFYETHAPEKVGDTDKNIKKYSRMESGFEDMWSTLFQKYRIDPATGRPLGAAAAGDPATTGSSRPDHQPAAAAGANVGTADQVTRQSADGWADESTQDANRARLYRFYMKYMPSKVGDISKQISKYADPAKGGYARMWQQLVDKYGPEPEDEERMLASMLDSGKKKPGRKYDPETREKWRQRLTKFYRYYAPGKGPSEIEDVLDRYGPPNGYETMWQQMIDKYGAEPVDAPSGFIGRYLEEDERADEAANTEYRNLFGPAAAGEGASPSPRNGGGGGSDDEDDNAGDPSPSERARRRGTSEAPTELSSNANPERRPYSPLGFNAVAVVLHALLRLQGATVMLYDKANEERQRNFRKAIEREVSINLGIEGRQVAVMTVKAGMSVELAIELTHEQVKFGVGEALVTRVLMGTFTVKHIREAYRRELGGNPIQLHTEGAAIYGGTCTPMFYDDAPHKPADNDTSMAMRMSSREVAEQWATDASPGEHARPMSYVPPAPAARGSSLQHGASPSRTEQSVASPILSPVSGVGATPTGVAGRAEAASPARGWGEMPTHPISSPPSKEAWMNEDERHAHTRMMNPHGLERKPASAPQMDPVNTHSFLERVWGRESMAKQLPYTRESKPIGTTVEGPSIAPANMSLGDWKERARREAMKPSYMSHTPSTNEVPMTTRTAPPSVTVFRPEALEEPLNATQRTLQEQRMRRDADTHHARELMRAVQSPVEYELEEARRRSGRGASPPRRPTWADTGSPAWPDPSSAHASEPRERSPQRPAEPAILYPSQDLVRARPSTNGAFANDPMMQTTRDQRSPSGVLDSRYQPTDATRNDPQSSPRSRGPGNPPPAGGGRASSAYLMDIVEALEV